MSFELLPTVTPFVVGFLVVAGLAVLLAVAATTDFLVSNRRVRVARHESIRTYYGRLALSH